jgi:hypothetical protein
MATRELTRITIKPTGMRLHEWICFERGFWALEGLDPQIDEHHHAGRLGPWGAYGQRPQDKSFVDGEEAIGNACAWGTVCNAGAGMGKVVPDVHGVARWAIYVRPDSRIRRPQDLAGVPVAVGYRAGSHYNVPYRLQEYLPLDQVQIAPVGGYQARLDALLDGTVEATSLLDPQIAMADQLGLRPVIANTFHTLWWVDARASRDVLERYFNALERAERELVRDPSPYLPLWRWSMPPDQRERGWDWSRFDAGERFLRQPLSRAEYDEVVAGIERWGLDDVMHEKAYDQLVLTA